MNNSLTYILGAGASFQSIPIVTTFPQRFSSFIESVNNFANQNTENYTYQKSLRNLAVVGGVLLKEFQNHQSFDTFFKKLYHTQDEKKIKLYKKILNLYFIWEHTKPGDNVTVLDKNNFTKQANVDKRYDALIAGLLQPIKGDKKLFCKTNFITWNYDLNLLSSIKNYFFPEITFAEMLANIRKDETVWKINDQLSILNMNGIFYSSVFDNVQKLPQTNSETLFESKLSEDYLEDKMDDRDAESIRFAWELENIIDVTSAAQQMIKFSKNIVVIGYTFPLYNRLVDFEYLFPDNVNQKRLFIQDPNAIELKEDFIEFFSLEGIRHSITPKTSCNHFFVPKDIFRY